MFFFKKKNIPPLDLAWLRTDMHSHLVPGIDDGAKDIATSLELIRGFIDLGYKKIITTPHVLWEIYPNTNDIINKGITELKAAIDAEGLDIEIHAAAEYFIDDHFEEALTKRKPLLCINNNLVLVEFSMVTAPFDLQKIIFELQMQEYQPVIAHPERYTYLLRNKSMLEQLKTAGCLFQLNLLSLTGYYGRSVQELAEHLVLNNCYELAGTDLHHAHHLSALQKLAVSPLYTRLKDSGFIQNRSLL
jgi:tyrosine-protein phosphatase YwqE